MTWHRAGMVLSNESDSSAFSLPGTNSSAGLETRYKASNMAQGIKVQSTKRSFRGLIEHSIPVLFFVRVNLCFVGALPPFGPSLAPLFAMQTKVLLCA